MAARAKKQKPEAKVRSQTSKLGSAAKPEALMSGPVPRPPFSETVFRAVRAIPRGQVRSYAQVALYAGRPGAARGVGHELTGLSEQRQHDVPWWRVIRSDGTLAPLVAHEQAKRLRAEGVEVRQRGEVFRVKLEDDGRG
ncbi:MGMT family protein [Pyxidicoccus trucidator]|uniref:MGMT family protein n=1 Tax=Pyxidicoccus trucidator TaxID=2709662 RepID=UPI0013D8F4DE|nr:MGMT family protein [Pyxidicoccus trucidator]